MRLIDANALVRDMLAERDKIPAGKIKHNQSMRGGIRKALRCVENAPTIDAEPVRHGRWNGTRCSNCLNDLSKWADAAYEAVECGDLKWCPCCGVKMDGGATDA